MIRDSSAGRTSDLAWFKSSYSSSSEGDSCVEVANTRTIHIRDSKHTTGPRLQFSPDAWADFVAYSARVRT